MEGSGCIHVAVDSFRSKLLLRLAGGPVVRRREGEWEREKEREKERERGQGYSLNFVQILVHFFLVLVVFSGGG